MRILEGKSPAITNADLNYRAMIRNEKLLPLDEFLDGPNWEGDGETLRATGTHEDHPELGAANGCISAAFLTKMDQCPSTLTGRIRDMQNHVTT